MPNAHIGRTVELRVADGDGPVVFLGEIIASHDLVAPGETAICDDHYGGAAVRPRPGGAGQDRRREGVLSPSGRWPRPSSRGPPPGG